MANPKEPSAAAPGAPRRRRPRLQAPPADPKYHWPPPHSALGTKVARLDGPDKVTGRAKYTFDINRPGMLYGRIVRSPHPHARIVSIDLSAAQRAPGVKATLAWRDPANTERNKVMYQGDEVAAVAADTEEHAIDAARLVKVEYEVLPHVILVEQALAGSAPAVFTTGNVRQGARRKPAISRPGSSRRRTRHRRDVFDARHHARVSRIPRRGVRVGGRSTSPPGCRRRASAPRATGTRSGLNIPQANVRVITAVHGRRLRQQVGGSDPQAIICARLAKDAKAPVKLMLDRKEEHLATGNRPSADGAHQSGGFGRRHADGVRRRDVGHRRRRRRSRIPAALHLPVSRTGGARTRTSSSTPASSGRCARRAIRRVPSSPKC